MPSVFQKILSESIAITNLKQKLVNTGGGSQNDKIELGQLVESALETHKAHEADIIIEKIKPVVDDIMVNKNITENMFLNIALLIPRSKEEELDKVVNEIGESYGDTATFKYVGPTAPFNFI